MAYQIIQLWARSDRYTHGGNSRQYIVVHNTANTATAKQEAQNLHNNSGQSSFQYAVDDTSIYQCVHDYDTAWAVGAWKGATPYIRNNQSISIEVCNPGKIFSDASIDRLHWLVRDLMEYYGIPADHVVRHWDCHSGRKACPAYYAGTGNKAWNELHALITSPYAEPEPPKPPLPDSLKGYSDLDSEAWYVDAVKEAVEKGWMSGYDSAHFGPGDSLTRGQAVCVVANVARAQLANYIEPYEDVDPNPYYLPALCWATDNGIVSGNDGKFRPDDPCTRAEFAAMLYNWQRCPDAPVLDDYEGAPEWVHAALDWAVGSGIMGDGGIRANDPCTRAEAAAMVTNLV